MPRQYNPKHFLRLTTTRLLGDYFSQAGLLGDVDISEGSEDEVDELHEAIMALSSEQRTRVDTDFQAVNEMAVESAMRIVREEAMYGGEDLTSAFAQLEGFNDRALWTFLNRRGLFEACLRFHQTDSLGQRYWFRTRSEDLFASANLDPARRADLEVALRQFFLRKEGKGQCCVVDTCERSGRRYWFAYVEDHGTVEAEFTDDGLGRRARRPAFEVVFVHSEKDGSIDCYHRGPRADHRELIHDFAFIVLGVDLKDNRDSERVYELDRLKRRSFEWPREPGWGIDEVQVKMLRLSALSPRRSHMVLSADVTGNPQAVYDLMEDVLDTQTPEVGDGGKVSIQRFHVTQADIRVVFGEATGRKPVRFRLTAPNRCNLQHDQEHAVVREMLMASGLERSGRA